MSSRRLKLHDILCKILECPNEGFENAYANNGVYLSQMRYSVTVMDKDPDSPIVGKVASLPTSRFNRHYEKDNLNHDVYTIFF